VRGCLKYGWSRADHGVMSELQPGRDAFTPLSSPLLDAARLGQPEEGGPVQRDGPAPGARARSKPAWAALLEPNGGVTVPSQASRPNSALPSLAKPEQAQVRQVPNQPMVPQGARSLLAGSHAAQAVPQGLAGQRLGNPPGLAPRSGPVPAPAGVPGAQALSAQALSAQALSAQALSAQALSAQALSAQALSAQALSAQPQSAQPQSARAAHALTARAAEPTRSAPKPGATRVGASPNPAPEDGIARAPDNAADPRSQDILPTRRKRSPFQLRLR